MIFIGLELDTVFVDHRGTITFSLAIFSIAFITNAPFCSAYLLES